MVGPNLESQAYQRLFSRILAVAIPLGAIGCSDYELSVTDGTDVFTQQPAEKVDILKGCGVHIVPTPADMGSTLAQLVGGKKAA